MSTLITEAKIIDKNSPHHLLIKNVLINKGKIDFIGDDTPKFSQIIEGKGCYLSHGLCDLQANYADPGDENKEDLETGLNTALAGGFTDVALLPNTLPPIQKKNDIKYLIKDNLNSITRIHPIGAISTDLKGEALTDILDLSEAGAIAFSDGLIPMRNSDLLLKSLLYTRKINGLIIDYPKDQWLGLFGSINEGKNSVLLGMNGVPALAEELAVIRDIEILAYTRGRLHLSNISTSKSVELIKSAKKKGLNITCDVAAHQLIYDDSSLLSFDTNYKVNPPFRSYSDIKALLKGIQDGTVDAIVSSHQPHSLECKQKEFDLAAFGIIGQQTILSMLFNVADILGWELILDKLTTQPRKILNLPIKTIEVNNSANLMLFNPEEKWHYNSASNISKSINSPLFNQTLRGKVKAVFNNSQQTIF